MRTRREQLRDVGGGLEHLLEVVEDEQRVSGAQEAEQQLLRIAAGGWRGDLEGGDDGGHHVARVAHAGEGHVEGAVAERRAERVGEMDREAGLAGAPGARERDEAGVRAAQQLGDELHLRAPADELPALDRREAARRSLERRAPGSNRSSALVAVKRSVSMSARSFSISSLSSAASENGR